MSVPRASGPGFSPDGHEESRWSGLLNRRVGRYERGVKPAMDRVGAVLALLLTSPIMAIAAAMVWLTLGQPVLLRQARVGHNERVFYVFKFRTMRPDRRRQQRPYQGEDRRVTHKSKDDPRHTRVGRYLRRWSLDELPQLVNVLSGEMSLVGPRPELVNVVANYDPWQHLRHSVKPGLTGLWQVSVRGEVPMHEATELDLEYIDRISLGTDLGIILRTIPALAGKRKGD